MRIKYLVFVAALFIIIDDIGAWRSLVARMTGGHEVAGSSPVAPIFSAFG